MTLPDSFEYEEYDGEKCVQPCRPERVGSIGPKPHSTLKWWGGWGGLFAESDTLPPLSLPFPCVLVPQEGNYQAECCNVSYSSRNKALTTCPWKGFESKWILFDPCFELTDSLIELRRGRPHFSLALPRQGQFQLYAHHGIPTALSHTQRQGHALESRGSRGISLASPPQPPPSLLASLTLMLMLHTHAAPFAQQHRQAGTHAGRRQEWVNHGMFD